MNLGIGAELDRINSTFEGRNNSTHGDDAVIVTNEKTWGNWTTLTDEAKTAADFAQLASADFELGCEPFEVSCAGFDHLIEVPRKKLLYRKDLNLPFEVVGQNYKPHQPREVIAAIDELCLELGLEPTGASSMKEGRIICVTAKTADNFVVGGDEYEKRYVFCISNDGKSASFMSQIANAMACNNQVEIFRRNARVTQNHRSEFDIEAFREAILAPVEAPKLDANGEVETDEQGNPLTIYVDPFQRFREDAERMAAIPVNRNLVKSLVMDVFHPGLDDDTLAEMEERERAAAMGRVTRTFDTILKAFENAPGQNLPGRQGTLLGLFNAITYNQQHDITPKTSGKLQGAAKTAAQDIARNQSNLIGTAGKIKTRALDKARELSLEYNVAVDDLLVDLLDRPVATKEAI